MVAGGGAGSLVGSVSFEVQGVGGGLIWCAGRVHEFPTYRAPGRGPGLARLLLSFNPHG